MNGQEHILDTGPYRLDILGSIVYPRVIQKNGDADRSILDGRTVMGERG
jgi:hypothetical protein